MRAKFISESLHFERGRDPKEALGLGMWARLKQDMKKDGLKYEDKEQGLRWASYFGNKGVVEFLLNAGADVHTSNDYALHWASLNGHKDVVEFLLNAGADVHVNNDIALRWASRQGHKEIVELLLKAGADVHARDDQAIRWASNNGHKDVVELLKQWMNKDNKKSQNIKNYGA